MINSFYKKYKNYIFAIIGFFVLTCIYFYPTLSGYTLRQNDVLQARGSQRELKHYRETENHSILWTQTMFSGMPTYQISLKQPTNLPKKVLNDTISSNLPWAIGIFFFMLLSAFILLLTLRVGLWPSVLGAVVFAFCTYNIVTLEAGHINKLYTMAYTPAILAGVILMVNKKYWGGMLLTILATCIQFSFNHYQIIYYTFLAIAIYFIYALIRAFKTKQYKPVIISAVFTCVAVALGVAINATILLTTYEYSKATIRGGSDLKTEKGKKDEGGLTQSYAFAWSYGIKESLTFLIPNVMGGASGSDLGKSSSTYNSLTSHGVAQAQAESFANNVPTYWGDQPFVAGPTYLGAIGLFFFLYFLLAAKSRSKWWILSMFLLALFIGWGKNFGLFADFMFSYFPLYNKFRSVSMALFISSMAVAAGAGLGVYHLFKSDLDKTKKLQWLYWSAGILGGICLIIAAMPNAFLSFENVKTDPRLIKMVGGQEWLLNAIVQDRISMARMDALRSALFIGLVLGITWLYLKNNLQAKWALPALAILASIDMLGVSMRYITPSDFKFKETDQIFQPRAADKQIMADTTLHFRVFDLRRSPFNDATSSAFFNSIGGYHGAKLQRYQELIEYHISKQNVEVINMLNTRYIISRAHKNTPAIAQLNQNALGNAWFVDSIKYVADANAAIEALNPSVFDAATMAIVNEKYSDYLQNIAPSDSSVNSIRLVSYHPEHLKYIYYSNKENLAVFSEIFYKKGWKSSIDGKPTKHIRVNYVLRALKVPAGKHTITFYFHPSSFYTGKTIALIGSIVFFTIIIVLLFLLWKKNKKSQLQQQTKEKQP